MCQLTEERSDNFNSTQNSAISIPYPHEELSNGLELCFCMTVNFETYTVGIKGSYVSDSPYITNSNYVTTVEVNSTAIVQNIEEKGTLVVTVAASTLSAVIVVLIVILVPLTVVVVRKRGWWSKSRSRCSENIYQ